MKNNIKRIIKQIQDAEFTLQGKQVTIGFDGFIDSIVRVVKDRKDQDNFTTFNDMGEFGNYIVSKKGKSCSLELDEQTTKIGGNMPIFAMALGSFGVNVNCIGAMGYPDVKNEFEPMLNNNCVLYSIEEPGYTTALEFHDGKVMMAKMDSIANITWESIKSKVGIAKLTDFFIQSRIIGIVNWSEVEHSSSIWEGIIRDIFPLHTPNKDQIVYFDLSDCSKRDQSEIRHAISIMGGVC